MEFPSSGPKPLTVEAFDTTSHLAHAARQARERGFDKLTLVDADTHHDETGSFNGPTLGNGTYWLNLSNAVANTGDPVYWDENSGMGCTSPGCPSQASENSVGTIPSESFTLLGSSTSGGGTVPEPGSLLLVAGGFISLAGVLRRRMR